MASLLSGACLQLIPMFGILGINSERELFIRSTIFLDIVRGNLGSCRLSVLDFDAMGWTRLNKVVGNGASCACDILIHNGAYYYFMV